MNIVFDQIQVSLSGSKILRGVSLTAENGLVTGLIGPNGCGKSTLIKSLFGIVPHQAGRILIGGTDSKMMSRRMIASKIGYVGQDSAGIFDFSVREVVEMGFFSRCGSLSRQEKNEVVTDALTALDLLPLQYRGVQTLSGGERKMVYVARALVQGVDTVILDEPTNHLDIRHQISLLQYLKSSGMTILVVLHDLHLATAFCDRLFLIRDGRNIADGAPAAVLTREMVDQVFGVCGYVESGARGDQFVLEMKLPEKRK